MKWVRASVYLCKRTQQHSARIHHTPYTHTQCASQAHTFFSEAMYSAILAVRSVVCVCVFMLVFVRARHYMLQNKSKPNGGEKKIPLVCTLGVTQISSNSSHTLCPLVHWNIWKLIWKYQFRNAFLIPKTMYGPQAFHSNRLFFFYFILWHPVDGGVVSIEIQRNKFATMHDSFVLRGYQMIYIYQNRKRNSHLWILNIEHWLLHIEWIKWQQHVDAYTRTWSRIYASTRKKIMVFDANSKSPRLTRKKNTHSHTQ